MNLRKRVARLAPPALADLAYRLSGRAMRFSGPYPDRATALAQSSGYADPGLLARVERATRDALRDDTAYEQDGALLHGPAPVTPVLAALLLAAGRASGRLSVLDVGGSLGTTWLRWRRWWDGLHAIDWRIVEQPHFVAAGRRLAAESGLPLAFFSSVDEVASAYTGVVLFGSSLQYLEDAEGVLASTLARRPLLVVADRTPISDDEQDHLLVQHVPRAFHPASYPMRLFGNEWLSSRLSNDFRQLATFAGAEAPIRSGASRGRFLGSIWIRRDAD